MTSLHDQQYQRTQSDTQGTGPLALTNKPGALLHGSLRKPSRLVVIDDYSTARGGATALALLCALGARDAGIAVTYLCGDDGDNEKLRAHGIEVISLAQKDLRNAPPLRAFTSGLNNRAARSLVETWIARHDEPGTIYHVHGWSKILSPSIFGALKPVADRCAVHAHDFFTACPNGAFYDYRSQTICERRPLGGSCIATQCDKRNYLQKLWRVGRGFNLAARLVREDAFGRIILIHPKMAGFFTRSGYDAERLKTIRNPASGYTVERVRAELNDEFVFVGRLDEEKGIEDILAAAEEAGVRLKVIGDGPLMERVRRSTGRVTATGWLSRHEIAQAVAGARALVMGSRYPEPFGMVAVEAAKSGLPVILPQSAFLADEMTALYASGEDRLTGMWRQC